MIPGGLKNNYILKINKNHNFMIIISIPLSNPRPSGISAIKST